MLYSTAHRYPDITKMVDGNLNTLAKNLFKKHIFFNSTSMRCEKIARTIISYYNDDSGGKLGSKLVQCCKRVKEHCTNKRSGFTDVIRKSTIAILLDPTNDIYNKNQSDEENTNSQENNYLNRSDIQEVRKRRSKGGYIMGEFQTVVMCQSGVTVVETQIFFSIFILYCRGEPIPSSKGCGQQVRYTFLSKAMGR
jgi:hypothetical protein